MKLNEPIKVSTKTGLVIILMSVLGIVLLANIFPEPSSVSGPTSGLSTFPQQEKAYVPDEIDLHIQAQGFVKQELKAPSTAEFPALPSKTSTDGNGLYRVISYVDSQNSFGAMIRSDWSVTMRISGNLWTLERMVIGGKVVYDPVEAKVQAKKTAQDKAELNAQIKATQKQIDDALKELESYQ